MDQTAHNHISLALRGTVFKPAALLLSLIPFSFFAIGYVVAAFCFGIIKVPAPCLLGLHVSSALSCAAGSGLGLVLRTTRQDDSLPEDTVIDQIPRPGYATPVHQAVLVTISTRSARPIMIDAVGQQVASLRSFAASSGLRVLTAQVPSDVSQGSCVAQYPSAGSSVQSDFIAVGCAAPRPCCWMVPRLVRQPVLQILERLATQRVQATIVHRQQVASGHQCDHCNVISQQPSQGSFIGDLGQVKVYLLVG